MSNTLIVYYSYGGNTEKVAKMIHEKTGFELLKLILKNRILEVMIR